jgi:hypothetical protein
MVFLARVTQALWLYPGCDRACVPVVRQCLDSGNPALDRPRLQSGKKGRHLMPVNCATLIVSQNERLNFQQTKKMGGVT